MTKRIAAVLALLLSVTAGTLFVGLVAANPLWFIQNPPPDEYTKPPVISIFSPTNNALFNTNNIVLSFRVDVGESETALTAALTNVWYETDWQPDKNYPTYSWDSSSLLCNVNLTEIPEGRHNLTVYATEKGTYEHRHRFTINGSKTVFFAINTNPKIDSIPEFPSWTPVFVVSVALVILSIVYRRNMYRVKRRFYDA